MHAVVPQPQTKQSRNCHIFNLIIQPLSTGAEDCRGRGKTGNRRGQVVSISSFEQLMVCQVRKYALSCDTLLFHQLKKYFLSSQGSIYLISNWFSVIKASWGQDQEIYNCCSWTTTCIVGKKFHEMGPIYIWVKLIINKIIWNFTLELAVTSKMLCTDNISSMVLLVFKLF